MSITATSYVLNHRFGSSTRKLIMIGIADFANDSGEAWPSIDTLAQRAECSRRTVQECIRQLEKDGDIQIRPNAGQNGCHRYRIIFRKTQALYTPRKPNNPTRAESAPPGSFEQVQNSDAQTAGGDADDRPHSAPEPLGTVKEPSRERAPARADGFSDLFRDTLDRIASLRPEWAAAPGYSKRERLAFMDNVQALEAVAPEHWETVRRYLAAKLPEGSAGFQPVSREQFLAASNDVLARALQWERKQPTFATRQKPAAPIQTPDEKAQAEKDVAEWLAQQSTVQPSLS